MAAFKSLRIHGSDELAAGGVLADAADGELGLVVCLTALADAGQLHACEVGRDVQREPANRSLVSSAATANRVDQILRFVV